MKIYLDSFNGNIVNLMRRLGYHPDRRSSRTEPSFSRPLRGGKFPRFHAYYNPGRKCLNLHLDQKAPRYSGASDHGAEYNSSLVKKEGQRIKSHVNN